MSELDAQAASGRTIKLIASRAGLNLVELPESYARIFRDAGARTAYTIRNRRLVPVMYFAKSAKDFADSATRWELVHSTLVLGDGAGRVSPLVNADGLVIGHFGVFGSSEIVVPAASAGDADLSRIVANGTVYAEKAATYRSAPDALYYVRAAQRGLRMNELGKGYTEFVQPQQRFGLLTDPTGGVHAVISQRDGDGIVASSVDILDLIEIPKLIYLAGKLAARKIVGSIVRRRLARAAARGVGREIGELIPQIRRQYKNLTHADLILWEAQGGHMLQRHNPLLTDELLLQRVLGPAKIPPEQFARMAKEAQEAFRLKRTLSVWQKNEALASSRWVSDARMRETVGDYIERNIDEIRNVTAQGKRFEGSLDVGRKTGEGWVTTEAGDLSRAALWDDNLEGFRIIIGPRKGYTYTPGDPEGWFLLTAYPDRI